MEAIAATTTGGTYLLAIDRNKVGDVGRLELHLSLVPGKDTGGIRDMLRNLSEALDLEGERDLMARMAALADELEQQDKGRKV